MPNRVLFVFDQVRHFHVPLFQGLEQRLSARGWELHLCRGEEAAGHARGSVHKQTIPFESGYRLRDHRIRSYTLRLGTGYLSLINELRPKVVVCPAHPGNLGHWLLCRRKERLGFKLVAWQCGYEYNPGRFKRALTRRFVPMFDHHLAYHTNARRYALENGAREEQVTVIHNTIDESKVELIDKRIAKERISQLHPQTRNRKILLYVGAVLEEKRLELLVEAMRGLREEPVSAIIVGDGPHLKALKQHSSDLGDSIIFAGRVVDGVGVYFDAADLFILPGTGGLGLNEAMAHGLPMLSSYADGSADDLVIDGETGFRLREGSTGELRDRIEQILQDPEMAEAMGARSREWSISKFSFKQFLGRIEKQLVANAPNS